MTNILTIEQVRKALYLDSDYEDIESLEDYSNWATSFISTKIGLDPNLLPEHGIIIAKDLAKMLIKGRHFQGQSKEFNEKYDYTMGINNAIVDLQSIVSMMGAV